MSFCLGICGCIDVFDVLPIEQEKGIPSSFEEHGNVRVFACIGEVLGSAHSICLLDAGNISWQVGVHSLMHHSMVPDSGSSEDSRLPGDWSSSPSGQRYCNLPKPQAGTHP